jgi:hypothetical protein
MLQQMVHGNWCLEMMDKDPLFKALKWDGPERVGHTILYDRLVNEDSY